MPMATELATAQSSSITSINPPSPRRLQSSHHHNHQECDMYITPKSLASRILNPLPTLIVDSRNPRKRHRIINRTATSGAIHHVPREFNNVDIRSTVEAAKYRRRECNSGISNPRCLLVVYSASEKDEEISLIAAYRLRSEIKRMGEGGEIVVKVLKGGLDSWIRVNGWDRRLVEGLFDGTYGVGGIRGLTMKTTTPVVVVEESCGTIDATGRDRLQYQYKCW